MQLLYRKYRTFPAWSHVRAKQLHARRYEPAEDGICAVFNASSRLPHANHVEMSGFLCSAIISYRIDEKQRLKLHRHTIFPSLRVNPDDTRGSLTVNFDGLRFTVNGKTERVDRVVFNGMLRFTSAADNVRITRTLCTAPEKPALLEALQLHCPADCTLAVNRFKPMRTVRACYMANGQAVRLYTEVFLNGQPLHSGKVKLFAGTNTLTAIYCIQPITAQEAEAQLQKRNTFLSESDARLHIETPNDDLNRELRFAKLRASESIFQTKNGLMHAPGGGQYYAALWTNDECEYANPLFAYLGYDAAQAQSLNCYGLYSALASPTRAIYTSIIAQGDGYWHGAGDRGDSSMYVYGFARYLLTTGDCENAKKYLPALEAACAYVMHRMNAEYVIESDSDELENRFESGKANLSTAVISYDAFVSMSYLEKELGNEEKSRCYADFADKVRIGIENWFEAEVEGFATYRYCAEETHLRSWICLPLTVGFDRRARGTAAALKSERLKKPCGLLTRSGEKTFWDRSLLYAVRGLFYVGLADDALEMLTEYTAARLYGEHVPYPIEAFPEGNGAHLSAESALYVRIFTEGVMGFRPVGFRAFTLKANLPSAWDEFSVRNFIYADVTLHICMKRSGQGIAIDIPQIGYHADTFPNQTVTVTLPGKETPAL